LEELKAPDGWLTLIGLHFLPVGESTLGRSAGNAIVLAAGPAHLGSVTPNGDGRVKLKLVPGVEAQVDGHAVLSAELDDGHGGRPPTVTCGTMSLYLITRGGKLALRVKDSAADRRVHFLGLDYYPIDPSWRIQARWVPFAHPRKVPITNVLGQVSPAVVPGQAIFIRDGHQYALLPIQESPGDPLFFIIADLTSGHGTYAAARFLSADTPVGGTVVLDFNQAENPPCAFTPFATCPLPPRENRLALAVTAGERAYRGDHD
ncbi:MAG: DUF1684 domain-containing protein, partial [Opitutales bacterium]